MTKRPFEYRDKSAALRRKARQAEHLRDWAQRKDDEDRQKQSLGRRDGDHGDRKR